MKLLALITLALVSVGTLHAEQTKVQVSALSFTLPEGWKSVEPKSAMRKAQLEVPGKDGGKPAEVTFFHFGTGGGGDIQANVSRWYAQFTGGADVQKKEELDFGGTKVTLVTTEGTLKAAPFAGIPEELPNAALLGAIVDHAEGAVFIKMTGPAELVKGSREKFLQLVKSAAEKK
jgi:hypothetical protein